VGPATEGVAPGARGCGGGGIVEGRGRDPGTGVGGGGADVPGESGDGGRGERGAGCEGGSGRSTPSSAARSHSTVPSSPGRVHTFRSGSHRLPGTAFTTSTWAAVNPLPKETSTRPGSTTWIRTSTGAVGQAGAGRVGVAGRPGADRAGSASKHRARPAGGTGSGDGGFAGSNMPPPRGRRRGCGMAGRDPGRPQGGAGWPLHAGTPAPDPAAAGVSPHCGRIRWRTRRPSRSIPGTLREKRAKLVRRNRSLPRAPTSTLAPRHPTAYIQPYGCTISSQRR
jgi:hypothetical protein